MLGDYRYRTKGGCWWLGPLILLLALTFAYVVEYIVTGSDPSVYQRF